MAGRSLPGALVPASDPALPGRFELARCGACDAVTLGEAPPDAYETGAYRPVEPRLPRVARRVLDRFDRQRRGVEAALRGAVVLQRAGWEDAEVEPDTLDAVVSWHVPEHLDDPAAAAARAAGWLRPGGVLLAGVPNLDSCQARVGGHRRYHLDVRSGGASGTAGSGGGAGGRPDPPRRHDREDRNAPEATWAELGLTWRPKSAHAPKPSRGKPPTPIQPSFVAAVQAASSEATASRRAPPRRASGNAAASASEAARA